MKPSPFPRRHSCTTYILEDDNDSFADSFTAPILRHGQRYHRGSYTALTHRPTSLRWSLLLCRKSTPNQLILPDRHSFRALVKEGNFTDILARLQSSVDGDSKTKLTDLKEWLYASSRDTAIIRLERSPLHALLQGIPPLLVVNAMIETLRQIHPATATVPEAMCDGLGRTPLHVACALACHVSVVARLLNGATAQFRQPAAVQDTSYNLPLHWACRATACARTEAEVDNLVHVIGFLVQVFPPGVDCPNGMGMTPLDILRVQRTLSPSTRQVLEDALQATRHTTDDETTLSLQLSWIPNEVCVDDFGETVSVLGGLKRPRTAKAPRLPEITESTQESTNVPSTQTKSSSETMVESTPMGALVSVLETASLVSDTDVPPVPILEETCLDKNVTDDWCPFERTVNRKFTKQDGKLRLIPRTVVTDTTTPVGTTSGSVASSALISWSSSFDAYCIMEMMVKEIVDD